MRRPLGEYTSVPLVSVRGDGCRYGSARRYHRGHVGVRAQSLTLRQIFIAGRRRGQTIAIRSGFSKHNRKPGSTKRTAHAHHRPLRAHIVRQMPTRTGNLIWQPEKPWMGMRPYGPLRGRGYELEMALAVIRRPLWHGASGVVLISGSAGAGKTALLSEVCRQTFQMKFRVARSKCDEIEQVSPGPPPQLRRVTSPVFPELNHLNR